MAARGGSFTITNVRIRTAEDTGPLSPDRKTTRSPISRFQPILALAVLAVLTAGQAAAQFGEFTLNRGVAEEPISLDPQYARLSSERAILADLFTGLVAEDAAGAIIPGVAKSWKISADGLTYTFKLRDDNLWSDGETVEAADFVYTFERLLAAKSDAPFASMFYNIKGAEARHTGKTEGAPGLGVRAKGSRTLVITIAAPAPDFLAQLTHHSVYPLRREIVEAEGGSWTRPGRFVSNGPYFLMEWKPGRFVQLVRNPRYHEAESVTLEAVYYFPAGDPDAGIERFLAGELDIFSGVPRDRAAALLKTSPAAVHLYPTLTVDYLVINATRPPMGDPKVRQALALGIDRQALLQKVLARGEIAADSIVPDEIANFQPPREALRTGPYPVPRPLSGRERQAIAKELIADAGYGVKDSLTVTLRYNVGKTNEKLVKAIAGMWRKIGIKTELYATDYMVHYSDLSAGDFQIARAGWIADYNDPAAILMMLDSASERFNYGRFSDREFDRLLKAAAGQKPEQRAATLYRATTVAMARYPVIPLYFHASRNLVAAYIEGWQDNIRDIHPSRYLKIVERQPVAARAPEPAPEPEHAPEPDPAPEPAAEPEPAVKPDIAPAAE